MPASTDMHNYAQLLNLSSYWTTFDADYYRQSVEAEAIRNYAQSVFIGAVSDGDVRSYFRHEYRRLFLANGMSKKAVDDFMTTDKSVDDMQDKAEQLDYQRTLDDSDVSAHRHQVNMLYSLITMMDIPMVDLGHWTETVGAIRNHRTDKTGDLRSFIRDGFQKILISYGWNEKEVQLLMATTPSNDDLLDIMTDIHDDPSHSYSNYIRDGFQKILISYGWDEKAVQLLMATTPSNDDLLNIMTDIHDDPSHSYNNYFPGHDVPGDWQAMRGVMEGQSVEGDKQAELAVMDGQSQ